MIKRLLTELNINHINAYFCRIIMEEATTTKRNNHGLNARRWSVWRGLNQNVLDGLTLLRK